MALVLPLLEPKDDELALAPLYPPNPAAASAVAALVAEAARAFVIPSSWPSPKSIRPRTVGAGPSIPVLMRDLPFAFDEAAADAADEEAAEPEEDGRSFMADMSVCCRMI